MKSSTGRAERIVIVGAGINGLAIGWLLARAGREVVVVDRGEAGKGATWAAAGMLAPHVEAEPGEERLLPLLRAGRDLWAGFAQELEAATGQAVGYRTDGTLVVARDADELRHLRFLYDFQKGLGLPLEWLSGYAARQREPHLAPGLAGAVLSPDDHQVDNRAVAVALKTAFLAAGGTLREHTPVDRVLVEDGAAIGIVCGNETVGAATVVVAAGAWSRNLGGLEPAVRPPVRPLKGQLVAVQMDPRAPLLEHVVWGRDGYYMVPRRDGRLIIGATVEEMGFDDRLTAGGQLELLRFAWELLPGIYDLPIAEAWVGFRPTSRDDAPILGPTAMPGLVMATGHHRNGILLAPITARAITRLILEGDLPKVVRPFTLARFTAPA